MRILGLFLLVVTTGSYAALGGAPISSVGLSARAASPVPYATSPVRYQLKTEAASGQFSVVEKTLDSGTTLSEYVSSDGVVFAVSWNGPFLPDLKELLGEYFSVMTDEANKAPKAGRSQLSVRASDVVIYSGGHMRAFEGKAWVPRLLPFGFSVASIR